MEKSLLATLGLLWAMTLVNLALTLKLIGWVRERNEERVRYAQGRPELPIGSEAPPFNAATLSGDPVNLDDYAGRRVAFIFSSPMCGSCRAEMPMLIRLAPKAWTTDRVEIVIVSEATAAETKLWLETMRREDGTEVSLPVVIAAPGESDFVEHYNPTGNTPTFVSSTKMVASLAVRCFSSRIGCGSSEGGRVLLDSPHGWHPQARKWVAGGRGLRTAPGSC